ncbi:hypothetical protein Goshw_007755 [Gossypium schwendimanii]|uniref:Uncharacterized protein n=1 Tax=Gossypium schwendimanii TaxID=34291 RepID=A0A7J9KWE9_GOSSC|nr:hypothetical protein [Gossypium schwendimanii]
MRSGFWDLIDIWGTVPFFMLNFGASWMAWFS